MAKIKNTILVKKYSYSIKMNVKLVKNKIRLLKCHQIFRNFTVLKIPDKINNLHSCSFLFFLTRFFVALGTKLILVDIKRKYKN